MGICEIISDRKDQILALAARYGVARSDNPKQEEKALQVILDNFGVLEFDDRAATLFGRITV
jgi:predicted nucleic acid-binding protein